MDGYSNTMIDGDTAMTNLVQHMQTNVIAPLRLSVRLSQQFWAHRASENRAANRNIVNISSTSGSTVYPFQGQAGYAASKAALEAVSGHMAAEFDSFGVRVNVVAPNSFPSIVSTESVAEAVVQLDRGTVTGTTVTVDA
jgi:NAD(P)-dependent dehydrogenase (short-subunit alcohol dehydrogenase family)